MSVYRLTAATMDNIWGGNKLREYGKSSDSDRIAESWELSFTKGGEATVADGRKTTEAFPRSTWGTNCEKFEFFPTLTKFIDAREKLSVQVHPADDYALANEGQYGKTEMWYIVDAEPGAGIYMGLNRKCTPEEFSLAVEDGSVTELLAFHPVTPGEVYFIPSGTVHAIGAGVLIYEIQQNSTLTYRLYDYMRRDASGNLRPLHVEKAMKVSILDVYEAAPRDEKKPEIIGKCRYFETAKYQLNFTNLRLNVTPDSFLSVTCIKGEGSILGEKISRGDSFFVPAGEGEIELSGNMEIITVSIPGE